MRTTSASARTAAGKIGTPSATTRRPAIVDRYHLIIETYTIPRIGKIKLKKLTSRDLQKLYKDLMEKGRIQKRSGKGNLGLSSTTVRSVHLTLHCAFERAVREG